MRSSRTLRSPLLTLAVLLIAPCTTSQAAQPVGGFAREFSVQWMDDSIWGHCDMRIDVSPEEKGTVTTACRSEDGPTKHKERKLSAAEVQQLRQLLKGADVFQGQFWGRDKRGLDLPLLTLQIDDGERVAVLVAVMNESFDAGPRKDLLESLSAILRSTDARRAAP